MQFVIFPNLRNPLYIKDTERGLLVGATGSGKSFLATQILQTKPQLFVIDVKHDFKLLNKTPVIYRKPEEVRKWKGNRTGEYALYRPNPDTADDLESWEQIFRILFYKKLTIGKGKRPFVYNDEAYLVISSPLKSPKYLKAIYNQGRALGIGTLAATQRPRGIPVYMRSECNRYWCFRLNTRNDVLVMAEVMGRQVSDKPANGHQFWFKSVEEEIPHKAILTIP
jgi:hypothetical protein